MQIPIGRISGFLGLFTVCVATIGVCIFCALTSVGALFFFGGKMTKFRSTHEKDVKLDVPRSWCCPANQEGIKRYDIKIILPTLPLDLYGYDYKGEKAQKYTINEINSEVIDNKLFISICGKKVFQRENYINSQVRLNWTLTCADKTEYCGYECFKCEVGQIIFLDVNEEINKNGEYKLKLSML